MQYIRHLLIGLCALGVLITLFIYGTGGNLSQLATLIIAGSFALNIGYLVFINELSHPSRLINMIAGYFALAAVELKYRAESARMEEEKAEASLPHLAKARSSRLEAAEEFLKYVANHGLQPQRKVSSPEVQQARLTQARSSVDAEGPSSSRFVTSLPASSQPGGSGLAEGSRASTSMSALPTPGQARSSFGADGPPPTRSVSSLPASAQAHSSPATDVPSPQTGGSSAAAGQPPSRPVSALPTSTHARKPVAVEGVRSSGSMPVLPSPPQARSSTNPT